ncbi:hypothetical protein JCM6882_001673 [Rhodosporidiobolus microsporus]
MDAFSALKTEEQLAAYLQRMVALVPNGQNPYTIFLSTLADTVNPSQPSAAGPLLILASAGSVVALLLYVAVWIIRYRKGTFWLMRFTRAGDERYLLFHYQNAWSVVASLMLLAFQGYVWALYRLNQGKAVDDLLFWVTLCWMPGVVAEIIACWTLTTTYILHRRTCSFGKAAPTPFYSSSLFISVSFSFLIAAYVTVLLYFSVQAGDEYSDMTGAFFETIAVLRTAEKGWTRSVDSNVFATIAAPMFRMLENGRHLVWSFRRCFLINGGFAIGVELLFLLVAITYIRSLKHSLKELAGKSPTGIETFSRTLRGLVAITASFMLYISLVSANAIWVAVLSKKVLTTGVFTLLSAVVPTLTVVAGALLIASVMLYQTLTSPPVYYTSPSARPTAVLPISTSRPSTAGSGRNPSTDLSPHYVRFALASSEPLPSLAFLSFSSAAAPHLGNGARAVARPFEDLELQPQPSKVSSDAGSTLSSWRSFRGRERKVSTGSTGGGVREGILVTREQVVSVVEVERDEFDIEELKEAEKGW